MGNYFLRKGTSKEATLFVRIRKRVPKIDKNVNTRIVIDRNVWERANKDASSLEKFYRTKDGQTIYRKMCAIDQALEELLCQGKFDDSFEKSQNCIKRCVAVPFSAESAPPPINLGLRGSIASIFFEMSKDSSCSFNSSG